MTRRGQLQWQAALLVLLQIGLCAGQFPDSPRRLFQPTPEDQAKPAVQEDTAEEDAAEKPVPTRPSRPELAFPPLPATRAPDQPGWNNSIAICTSIKNENAEDLVEWVMYHKWRGVDHIGIVENNFTVTPEIRDVLEPYIASGFVYFSAVGTDRASQHRAFGQCFEQMRLTHNWVAFFDADEYLMLLDGNQDLKSLLNEYKEHPALSVNWVTFGPSGRQKRPPGGGVLRWYMRCSHTLNERVKSIVNTYDLLSLDNHVHNFHYRGGRQSVSEDFQLVPWFDGDRAEETKRCNLPDDDVTGGVQCLKQPGSKSNLQEIKRIALFHYVTRSWEDFSIKMKRGGGMVQSQPKTESFFNMVRDDTQDAGGICDEGILAWDHCCSSGRIEQ